MLHHNTPEAAPPESTALRVRRRGIYLLPNLFTLAALFCGFYGVIQAINQHFDSACLMIFAAMVLDGMDGRVARLTGTQSEFGAELDSLADMVSFGLAPALIVYEWALRGLGKIGGATAFLYCACAALRLARFNVNLATTDKRFFQGLPSPAAAGLLVGLVWYLSDAGIKGTDAAHGMLAAALFAGVTMVTNTPFYSFKDISSLKRTVPFIFLAIVPLLLAALAYHPTISLLLFFLVYGVSGYVLYIWRKVRGKPAVLIATEEQEEDVYP